MWEPYGTHITTPGKMWRLIGRTVLPNDTLFGGTVLPNITLFGGTVMPNQMTLLLEMHPLALSSHLCIPFLNSSQSHCFKFWKHISLLRRMTILIMVHCWKLWKQNSVLRWMVCHNPSMRLLTKADFYVTKGKSNGWNPHFSNEHNLFNGWVFDIVRMFIFATNFKCT